MGELENDTGKCRLCNLGNGATRGYNKDLGNAPEVPTEATKQRVYDEARDFLRNYKTAICKENATR